MESKKCFAKHASSKYHTEAIIALISIPTTKRNISDMVSSEYVKIKRENAAVLMKLLNTSDVKGWLFVVMGLMTIICNGSLYAVKMASG